MATASSNTTPHRLPSTARPELYDLQLTPDLDRFTFKGVLAVTVQILETTDDLVMHGLNLSIDQSSVKWVTSLTDSTESKETQASSIVLKVVEQQVVVSFPAGTLIKG